MVFLPVEFFINQLDRDPLPFAASTSSFFFFILLSLRGIFELQNTHTGTFHTCTHTHTQGHFINFSEIYNVFTQHCDVRSGQVYYSFYTGIFKCISREMLLTLQAKVFLLCKHYCCFCRKKLSCLKYNFMLILF